MPSSMIDWTLQVTLTPWTVERSGSSELYAAKCHKMEWARTG